MDHLNAALGFYYEGLGLLPAGAVNDLAVTHTSLGAIYGEAGNLDRALPHYRQGLSYFEAAGDLYEAARHRRNIAINLARAGRLADAREYAYAALHNYETFGERAADKIQKTQQLIADIEAAMKQSSPPSLGGGEVR